MIAILQTAFLGDTLLSIPLARALRAEGHELLLICRQGLRPLFSEFGFFADVVEVTKGNQASYRKSLQQACQADLLISPHESIRSKLFAMQIRLKGVATVGYSDWALSHFAYERAIDRPMHRPEALRQLSLLQADLGRWDSDLWKNRLREFDGRQRHDGGRLEDGQLVDVPEWASMEVDRFSKEQRRRREIVLAPGSVWETKRWTELGFSQVAVSFLEKGYSVRLVGSQSERLICDRVEAAIREKNPKAAVINVAGETDLLTMTRMLAQAEGALTNDSGAMHIAAMAGTPVVGVFGPTVLSFGYRPWSSKARVVEPMETLRCRPCGTHGGRLCPIGTHECMTGITSTAVVSALETVLKT